MSSAATPADRLSFTIHADQDGRRVDAVLAEMSGLSRNHIQQLIKQQHIQNHRGETIKQASVRVHEYETYVVNIPPLAPVELAAEDIPLDILFEDEHLIILNKPAGMVVHPAHGHQQGTLVHALLHHCSDLPGINGVERPGIVHRLDKDTSGSMVIAKSEMAHRRLTAMFAAHDLNRQYVAWCRGNPNWHARHIELAIGRHPQHRQKMAIQPQGKMAVTDAEVERQFGSFSRLRLTLHTGRTHQIRVHLAHEKLPILGDAVYARSYNPAGNIPEPARTAIRTLERQALHAELLEFAHPVTAQMLSFSAPLPDDLQRLNDALARSYR